MPSKNHRVSLTVPDDVYDKLSVVSKIWELPVATVALLCVKHVLFELIEGDE